MNIQKILTIAVGCFIIYSVLNAKMHNLNTKSDVSSVDVTVQNADANVEMTGNFIEKTMSTVISNVMKTPEGRTFFENIVRPVNINSKDETGQGMIFDYTKIVPSLFRVHTTGDINGRGPASCGQRVNIQYSILNTDDIVVDHGTKTFLIGSREMIPALENMIVGMYVGQSREGTAMPKYAYDNPKFQGPNKQPSLNYKIKVTLLAIEDEVFMNTSNVRVFDDRIAYQIPYLCGDDVVFDVKISRVDGKVLYDSVALGTTCQMRLGDTSYPRLFSYALFGKMPSSNRVVITQGKYLKSIHQKHDRVADIKLDVPDYEYLIIEFDNSKEIIKQ